MKLARVQIENGSVVHVVQGDDGSLYRCEGGSFFDPPSLCITDEVVQAVRFLPPVEPRSILCAGANYHGHISECKLTPQSDPVFFMKNPAAAIGHQHPIVIPACCGDEVDYEAELAAVIGRDCLSVDRAGAADCIAGYLCANDVSARVWQLKRGGGQWVRGKSFDTFAPMGPFLVTPDEVGDPGNLAIRTRLNGETVQESTTACMIHDVLDLISFFSQGTTLPAGTVVLTGTPEGVGWFRTPRKLLHAGSTVEIEIERIGTLVNPVIPFPCPA